MSSRPIARSALIVGLGNIGSRVLGLVREQVIAALFGATASTDAFRVAFRVPLSLYDLLIGGMVSSALVPVFSGYLARGERRDLGRAASSLTNVAALVLLAAVVALSLLAGPLMRLLAAGYDEPVQRLSTELVRVLLPALLFMGVSAVFTALLYSQERFGLPAFAIMSFNAGIVVAALLLHGALGIASVAAGVVAGAALQFALQARALRDAGYRLAFELAHPGVRQVLRLYLPVALGLVVSTIGVLIDTNLASHTGEGSLAAMGFATTLVQFPLGLVASGVSSAVLPVLSRHAEEASGPAAGAIPAESGAIHSQAEPLLLPGGTGGAGAVAAAGREAYRDALGLGLRLVLITIIPATVGLLLLREPVIRLLFERGAFDAEATARTATAFLAYSPGLPAAALDQILIQGFYARRRTIEPVLVGVASVGVYIAVALSLVGPFGMPGLALANSAQWTSHLLIMAVLTHRAVGGLGRLRAGSTALRCLAAVLPVAALLVAAQSLIPPAGLSAVLLAGFVAALVVLSAALYLGVLAAIARDEVSLLTSALRRRG